MLAALGSSAQTCLMLWRLLTLVFATAIATSSNAQGPPSFSDMYGGPPVTPMQWKHEWLSEPNTGWYYVSRPGRPLVINLPAAPADGSYGLNPHIWRLFYDDGYALGALTWRDDRGRTQPARKSVDGMITQVAEVRATPARFGGFDPKRIIVTGWGEDAFPAAVVAFNSGPRGSSPVCAAVFFDGMNFDTARPESRTAKRRFAEDPTPAQISPMRYAANAPPILLMTEILNATSAKHSDALAQAIRASGGIAVRATFPRFVARDSTTYLGYSGNPSTKIISDFIRTYCPPESER